MPTIRNRSTGAVITVSDALAQKMTMSGMWADKEQERPAPAPAPKRRGRPKKEVTPEED